MILGSSDHFLQEADRALRTVTCRCQGRGEDQTGFDLVAHGTARGGAFGRPLRWCHGFFGPAFDEQDFRSDPVVPDLVPPAAQAGRVVEQGVRLLGQPEAQRVGGEAEQDVRAGLFVFS